MDNAQREKGRYGGKHHGKGKAEKRKSHDKTDPKDWDQQHAKEFLESDEGKDAQEKLSRAQELMNAAPAADQSGDQTGAAPAAPAGVPPAALAAAAGQGA